MARDTRGRARRGHEPASEIITYFFLTQYTASWHSITEIQALRDRVTQLVVSEGGRCKLFLTPGSIYDSISIVEGVTPAGALRIAEAIQLGGHRITRILSGYQADGK